jgi:hypothetical protein
MLPTFEHQHWCAFSRCILIRTMNKPKWNIGPIQALAVSKTVIIMRKQSICQLVAQQRELFHHSGDGSWREMSDVNHESCAMIRIMIDAPLVWYGLIWYGLIWHGRVIICYSLATAWCGRMRRCVSLFPRPTFEWRAENEMSARQRLESRGKGRSPRGRWRENLQDSSIFCGQIYWFPIKCSLNSKPKDSVIASNEILVQPLGLMKPWHMVINGRISLESLRCFVSGIMRWACLNMGYTMMSK